MIKIAIEMVRESNLTKAPALRLVLFEQDQDPAIQPKPWWMVKDILEWDATRYEMMEKHLGDLLNHTITPEGCESITICPNEPNVGRVTIDMNYDGVVEPTEPFIYPVLKAVYKQWFDMVAPVKVAS